MSVHCTGCHAFLADGGPGVGIAFGNLDMGDAAVAFLSLVGDGGGVLAQGMGAGAAGVTCATLAADAGLNAWSRTTRPTASSSTRSRAKKTAGPPCSVAIRCPRKGPPWRRPT